MSQSLPVLPVAAPAPLIWGCSAQRRELEESTEVHFCYHATNEILEQLLQLILKATSAFLVKHEKSRSASYKLAKLKVLPIISLW